MGSGPGPARLAAPRPALTAHCVALLTGNVFGGNNQMILPFRICNGLGLSTALWLCHEPGDWRPAGGGTAAARRAAAGGVWAQAAPCRQNNFWGCLKLLRARCCADSVAGRQDALARMQTLVAPPRRASITTLLCPPPATGCPAARPQQALPGPTLDRFFVISGSPAPPHPHPLGFESGSMQAALVSQPLAVRPARRLQAGRRAVRVQAVVPPVIQQVAGDQVVKVGVNGFGRIGERCRAGRRPPRVARRWLPPRAGCCCGMASLCSMRQGPWQKALDSCSSSSSLAPRAACTPPSTARGARPAPSSPTVLPQAASCCARQCSTRAWRLWR